MTVRTEAVAAAVVVATVPVTDAVEVVVEAMEVGLVVAAAAA